MLLLAGADHPHSFPPATLDRRVPTWWAPGRRASFLNPDPYVPPLDIDTLLLVYEVLGAMVLAFTLAGAWHARSRESLWMWAGGFAAVSLSQLIRHPVVDVWGYRASLPVGHIGALLHAALLTAGVRSFARLRPAPGLLVLLTGAGAAASLASVYLLGMRPGWSLASTQAAAGLLLASGAYATARAYRHTRHVTLRIMAAVLGLSALVAVARGASVLSRLLSPGLPSGPGMDSANAPWLLATLVLLVAQGFAILLLVNGALQREVRALAELDPLTGLLNRRGLDARVERVLHRVAREESTHGLAVMAIDLDHFKAVNDRFGHVGGDQVLVSLAQRLQRIVRPLDLVARLGGEEFVVILHGVQPDTLPALAERVRESLSAAPVETDLGTIEITVSMGVAVTRGEEPLASALERADQALYRAKREGRDRVAFADLARVS